MPSLSVISRRPVRLRRESASAHRKQVRWDSVRRHADVRQHQFLDAVVRGSARLVSGAIRCNYSRRDRKNFTTPRRHGRGRR